MAITFLDVQGITDAAKDFRDKVREFNECVETVKTATVLAKENWLGYGRDAFDKEMRSMMKQLDDITDILYEVYEALVKAETGYIDTDEEIGKQFSANPVNQGRG